MTFGRLCVSCVFRISSSQFTCYILVIKTIATSYFNHRNHRRHIYYRRRL